jgi:hypothetical protein
MDADLFAARREELSALADEVENSDRPTRVKIIRLRHLRDEMTKLISQAEAAIDEEIEKAKSGAGSL